MTFAKRKKRTPLYKSVELFKALYRSDLIGVIRTTGSQPEIILDLSDLDFLEKIVPQFDFEDILKNAPNTVSQYGGVHIFKIHEHTEDHEFVQMLADENLISCYIMPYYRDNKLEGYLFMGYVFKNFYYMKPEDFNKIAQEMASHAID